MQFSAWKSVEGGAEGVEELVKAVDLGACLVLTHMDLDSMRDPAVQPQSLEAAAKVGQKLEASPSLSIDCGGNTLCGCGGGT